MKKKSQIIGFLIWFLAAFFFLYEFFLRVFVSTISNSIMDEMHLDAQEFAMMGAGYYLTYAVMQIPVGILVDRYGSRILLTIATTIAALGGFWFAFSYDFVVGFLSRCLMGFGSSFAYVCLLVLALNWFPRKYFGFMVGVATFLGAIGPMLAGGPLALLITAFDNNWRLVLSGIGIFGFILATIIGLFVRNAPTRKKGDIIHLDPYKESLFTRLRLLLKNPQAWCVILYSGFVYVCLPLLGAYWGTSFLQTYGFSRSVSASISSMLWIGLAVGSPLFGKLSDRMRKRKPFLYISALIGVTATFIVIHLQTHNWLIYSILFFLIGVASSGISVSFAIVAEHVQSKLHATAIGLNNTFILLFAAILPSFVSSMIDKSAKMHQVGDKVIYTTADFHAGFFLMPVFYGLAFLLAFFLIKETYCRQQFEVIKVK